LQLAAALIAAGVAAITHDSVFAQDTPDEEWLTRAGYEGWVVLTKDKLIRKRPIEREALVAAHADSRLSRTSLPRVVFVRV
jgi:hypothetical protein